MTDTFIQAGYTILLTRRGGECIASIPELCIAERAADSITALAAALKAEADVLRDCETRALPLPPVKESLDPFQAVSRFAQRHIGFVAKVVAGYVLVLCLAAATLVLIYPAARSSVDQYIASKDIPALISKAKTKLGIVACSESR
jgi:hypothetical protein